MNRKKMILVLGGAYSGKLEFVIDVSLMGRHSSGTMKVTLLCKN